MQRIALVTGGARGIGAETCRALADQGLSVAVADLNADGARERARTLPGQGHTAHTVDVAEEQQVQGLFNEVERTMGPIAVLVCVAGGPFIKPGVRLRLTDTSLENWVKTEALNGRGTFLCVREFLRRREKAPLPDSRIVNVASMAGIAVNPGTGVSYGAAKSAVLNITRHAAMEGAPLGITANAIAPGLIDTPAVRANSNAAQIEEMTRRVPLGSMGQPVDIAATIAFLVSPQARYLTGCTIEINGGTHMA